MLCLRAREQPARPLLACSETATAPKLVEDCPAARVGRLPIGRQRRERVNSVSSFFFFLDGRGNAKPCQRSSRRLGSHPGNEHSIKSPKRGTERRAVFEDKALAMFLLSISPYLARALV